MVDIDQLIDDMADAKERVKNAGERLRKLTPGAPEYQGERVAYLHALVSHMSMVAVAQARQHQQLSETVVRLESEMKVIRERFAAITRPVGVWP